ncbi:MAG: restriction endonuclease subunit S [Alphaproteobacteria bacterium]|nr:restriction endonuclease subunit S [Alphaproteobacteria bacterium]
MIDPARPITYGVVQPGEHDPLGVPLIRGGDFSFGWKPIEDYRRVSPEIESAFSRARLKPGDLVITIKGDVGAAAIVPEFLDGANLSQTNARLAIDDNKADASLILAFLESHEGRKQIAAVTQVGAQPGLIFRDIQAFRLKLPPLPEQRKIAEILRTWDEAIDTCERRGDYLRKQVEGLRLKLFEAAYASTVRVRQAKELFEPVSEKNQPDLPLLAVMQDIGVVRRDELDRRVVMPDGSTDGYKVVREGDFVISLRSFEGGLEFSRVTGLVSPAYTVLRPSGGDYDGDYYRHFFKSRSFIGRLDRLIFGIRDGKQISFRDFGDMKIPNPTEDDQTTAATVLGLAEQQIALADQEAAKLQEQKRGLMQKLLTGEWRVTVEEGLP